MVRVDWFGVRRRAFAEVHDVITVFVPFSDRCWGELINGKLLVVKKEALWSEQGVRQVFVLSKWRVYPFFLQRIQGASGDPEKFILQQVTAILPIGNEPIDLVYTKQEVVRVKISHRRFQASLAHRHSAFAGPLSLYKETFSTHILPFLTITPKKIPEHCSSKKYQSRSTNPSFSSSETGQRTVSGSSHTQNPSPF